VLELWHSALSNIHVTDVRHWLEFYHIDDRFPPLRRMAHEVLCFRGGWHMRFSVSFTANPLSGTIGNIPYVGVP
jgi:hypothetical protein